MGLVITLQSVSQEKMAANMPYFNVDVEDELPFDTRCGMRTIANLNNDWSLFEALQETTDVDNCQYIILEENDLKNLFQKDISEEAKEAISTALDTVNFEIESVALYPWW